MDNFFDINSDLILNEPTERKCATWELTNEQHLPTMERFEADYAGLVSDTHAWRSMEPNSATCC